MAVERILSYSRILLACSIVLIIVAVILYFAFDIKRIVKILKGKATKPSGYVNKVNKVNKRDDKTEVLTD